MKNVTYEPLGDRILVKVAAATSKIGMLEIPNAVQETPNYGTVMEVSREDLGVSVGDVVLYNKYGGFSIYHEFPMVMLRPVDLIARVHGKTEADHATLLKFLETGDKSLFETPKNPMVEDGSLFTMAAKQEPMNA